VLRQTLGLALLASLCRLSTAGDLHLNELDYFETQGLSVLAYQNSFHPVFRDQKLGGIEIILHGERIATDGEVRLQPTPEQWDPVPTFTARKRGAVPDQLIASSGYPDLDLSYRVEVTAEGEGFRIALHLDKPLPAELAGKAGFNLDFLPTAYFGKSYRADEAFGIFPRHPEGPMRVGADGVAEPQPLTAGRRIVLAPEDPTTRVTLSSESGKIMLFDARNRAQNGWFVLRELIPVNRTENALVWHVHPNVIAGWIRPPVVSYNQVGYTPDRFKVALLEFDSRYQPPPTARILRLTDTGKYQEVFRGAIKPWGPWLRYRYASFDFSPLRKPGVYAIDYAGRRSGPFRIAADVYAHGLWQPSLDTYLAVQMDHVKVRENYRVWHGVSHMDDARQAPLNHIHFDGYSMGASSDSPFAAGEHVPGLNRGGWFDAGDYDLRTQTQARVITDLVLTQEAFHIDWDETTVDEDARLVQIRRPDGVPDILQQIKHGVLALLAQYAAFGHAVPGIVEPTLEEYTHLGDAASQTDGKLFDPRLSPLESNGIYSGVPDDRWVFTSHTTPLNYAAAASLAAASRVLREIDPGLAAQCLQTAVQAWNAEHSHPPVIFRSFNTTGGELEDEEVGAATELLLATQGDAVYQARLVALLPVIQKNFSALGWIAVRALPFMDSSFKSALEAALRQFKVKQDADLSHNPFGVPINTGTWGGSESVVRFAAHMYFLHQAFPGIVGTDEVLRGFDYVLGRHPVSNVSYVSTVGTASKLIGYGNNRADYTFIPGGMIPGVVIIQPDFPELKDAWPFLWYENEYVVDAATGFILAANAAAFLTGTSQHAGTIDPAKIDAALSRFIETKTLIGVSALVFKDGHEAYFGTFGQADREAGKPMTRDTLVQIYSMTKPIAGVALMSLYEAGKFRLDDPLAKYLPEFADLRVYSGVDAHGEAVYEAPRRPVTIRDITRHTAGFYGGTDPSPVAEMYRAVDPTNSNNSLAAEAKKLGSLPLLYQPGTRWLYGPSVDLQAYVVERLSGMPFDQYLQRKIFTPLGMTSTRYLLKPQDRARLAAMYDWHQDGSLTREPDAVAFEFNSRDWPAKPGSYGLVSTLDDYMRFARMLQNGGELDGKRILKPETIRLMATDAMPPEVTDISWLPSKGSVGFGIDFAVRRVPPADAAEASGAVGEFFWDGAADTLFWVDPKNKITAVLFTQYKPFGKVPLHKAFRDAVYANFPDALAQ
jgi:endoglucanase